MVLSWISSATRRTSVLTNSQISCCRQFEDFEAMNSFEDVDEAGASQGQDAGDH